MADKKINGGRVMKKITPNMANTKLPISKLTPSLVTCSTKAAGPRLQPNNVNPISFMNVKNVTFANGQVGTILSPVLENSLPQITRFSMPENITISGIPVQITKDQSLTRTLQPNNGETIKQCPQSNIGDKNLSRENQYLQPAPESSSSGRGGIYHDLACHSIAAVNEQIKQCLAPLNEPIQQSPTPVHVINKQCSVPLHITKKQYPTIISHNGQRGLLRKLVVRCSSSHTSNQPSSSPPEPNKQCPVRDEHTKPLLVNGFMVKQEPTTDLELIKPSCVTLEKDTESCPENEKDTESTLSSPELDDEYDVPNTIESGSDHKKLHSELRHANQQNPEQEDSIQEGSIRKQRTSKIKARDNLIKVLKRGKNSIRNPFERFEEVIPPTCPKKQRLESEPSDSSQHHDETFNCDVDHNYIPEDKDKFDRKILIEWLHENYMEDAEERTVCSELYEAFLQDFPHWEKQNLKCLFSKYIKKNFPKTRIVRDRVRGDWMKFVKVYRGLVKRIKAEIEVIDFEMFVQSIPKSFFVTQTQTESDLKRVQFGRSLTDSRGFRSFLEVTVFENGCMEMGVGNTSILEQAGMTSLNNFGRSTQDRLFGIISRAQPCEGFILSQCPREIKVFSEVKRFSDNAYLFYSMYCEKIMEVSHIGNKIMCGKCKSLERQIKHMISEEAASENETDSENETEGT